MAAITFLGTGPGSVVPGRLQSSLLLETDQSSVLLDAGEPCANQLLNLGVSLAELDAVWITHGHADHIGGLPLLLQALKLHGRTEPLPLGLPGYLHDPVDAWLRAILLSPEALGFSLPRISWEAGQSVESGGLSVVPHLSSHLAAAGAENPQVQAYLLEVQAGTKRIVYTGDLGGVGDLAPLVIEPIDLLICELAHLSVGLLIDALKPATVGTLCLTHVADELDDQREEILMRCERELPGVDETYLPEDGERIEF